MSDLNEYWGQYTSNTTTAGTASTVSNCHIYPYTDWDYNYYPHYTWYSHPPVRNRKEEAFEVLKVLVEEKLVKEPTTFKKFCDLVEKIAKVI